MQHELGIDPSQLAGATYKYMGRVHYWAADTLAHGPAAPWVTSRAGSPLNTFTNLEIQLPV